ncbi:hypothetical protein EVAR_86950_1 [Eumeta japonica]|uniref:BESS domain-containing protein n=1 Tax=Eumeta variegata TaxID=151549 RepID=A0A4C1W997_EUMVA|nr:hypothetical protein EVAR_86950_1 [Eumeta japonica]
MFVGVIADVLGCSGGRSAQVVAHPQLVLAAPAQRAARRAHRPRPRRLALVPGRRARLPTRAHGHRHESITDTRRPRSTHCRTDRLRPSPFSTYAPSFLEMDMSEQTLPESADVKPFLGAPWFLSGRERATSPVAPPPAAVGSGSSLGPTAGFGPAHALGPGPALAYAPRRFDDDSNSGSNTFGPDENSSYFQFFRGIYNDYQELPERKQRQFKRQCLHILHELLDEEEARRDAEGSSPNSRPQPDDGFDEKCEVILPNL